MDYQEAVDYLYGLGKFSSKPGLSRMKWLLKRLGEPHRDTPTIHVAGTNGKGSTSSYISCSFRQAGYRAVQYSSPHLQTIRERILLNGDLIGTEDFARTITRVREAVQWGLQRGYDHPTFFEIMTTGLFAYCSEADVDVLVLEVGLGGRFDATNVVGPPEVAVITNIGLEHTEVLGDTAAEIAFEKAGIIKTGTLAVVGCQDSEALGVIADVARQRNVPLVQLVGPDSESVFGDSSAAYRLLRLDAEGGALSYRGPRWELPEVEISMLGRHQLQNAAVAVAALEQAAGGSFDISAEDVLNGMRQARWPGRVERVAEDPLVILDGAHNPTGASVLAETVQNLFAGRRVHSVVGMLDDKDYRSMLGPMQGVVDGTVVVTRAPTPRGLDACTLRQAAEKVLDASEVLRCNDPKRAVEMCLKHADEDDVVVIWGSLYLIGEVRGRWQKTP